MDSEYDAAEAEWMIEHKKSKEAQDLQQELDIFDDSCTMLESQRVTCICSFASVPPLPVWHAAGLVQAQLSSVYIAGHLSVGLSFRLRRIYWLWQFV